MPSPSTTQSVALIAEVRSSIPANLPELHRDLCSRMAAEFDIPNASAFLAAASDINVVPRGRDADASLSFQIKHPDRNIIVSIPMAGTDSPVWSQALRLIDPTYAASIVATMVETKPGAEFVAAAPTPTLRIVEKVLDGVLAQKGFESEPQISKFASCFSVDRVRCIGMAANQFALHRDHSRAGPMADAVLNIARSFSQGEYPPGNPLYAAPFVAHEILSTSMLGLLQNQTLAGEAPHGENGTRLDAFASQLTLLVNDHPEVPAWASFGRPGGVVSLAVAYLRQGPEVLDAWTGPVENISAKGIIVGTALQILHDHAKKQDDGIGAALAGFAGASDNPSSRSAHSLEVLTAQAEELTQAIIDRLEAISDDDSESIRNERITLRESCQELSVGLIATALARGDLIQAREILENVEDEIYNPAPLHLQVVEENLRRGLTVDALEVFARGASAIGNLRDLGDYVSQGIRLFGSPSRDLQATLSQNSEDPFVRCFGDAVQLIRHCHEALAAGPLASEHPERRAVSAEIIQALRTKMIAASGSRAEEIVALIEDRPTDGDMKLAVLQSIAKMVTEHVADRALANTVVEQLHETSESLQVSSKRESTRRVGFSLLAAAGGDLNLAVQIDPAAKRGSPAYCDLLAQRIGGAERADDVTAVVNEFKLSAASEYSASFVQDPAAAVQRYGMELGSLTWTLVKSGRAELAEKITDYALAEASKGMAPDSKARFTLSYSLAFLEPYTSAFRADFRGNAYRLV